VEKEWGVMEGRGKKGKWEGEETAGEMDRDSHAVKCSRDFWSRFDMSGREKPRRARRDKR